MARARWQRTKANDPGRRPGGWLPSLGCAAGLATVAMGLYFAGPPPSVRPETLWAHAHGDEIRVAIAGLAAAMVCSFAGLFSVRHRWRLAIVWVIGGLAIGYAFSDRIPLVTRIVVKHLL